MDATLTLGGHRFVYTRFRGIITQVSKLLGKDYQIGRDSKLTLLRVPLVTEDGSFPVSFLLSLMN